MERGSGRWALRYSFPNACPYFIWEKRVPRIGDHFTDCAVYIYQSFSDAKNGVRQGGSGFLVGVPLEKFPDRHWCYVITNKHVVVKAGEPVIRLNRKDGQTECFPTKITDWNMHPYGDDIAVLPFHFDPTGMRYMPIGIDVFLTKQLAVDEDVGIGDDTFMVGRFINHEGKQRNTPSVRFGNIAMLPTEPITSEFGIEQESFLVEIRSLPGYSGSAVFVYSPCAMNDMSVRRFGTDRPRKTDDPNPFSEANRELFRVRTEHMRPKGPYLLGIDWCHIQSTNPVREKNGEVTSEGWIVQANTGMAGVIPAWKINEALNVDELVSIRKQNELKFIEEQSGIALD